MKDPSPSEDEFFRSRPDVSGLAAEDNAVVVNPHSPLTEAQFEAVMLNEAARVFMRVHGPRPNFEITREQAAAYTGYGTLQDTRETIAARLLSGDPSAGDPNEEQRLFVAKLSQAMLGRK